MSSQKVASITKPEIKGPVVNGVPTGQLLEVIGNIQQDAEKALVSCLATTMVYHAAVQGIVIESVESQVEGDIDVRGFFGLSDEVRKGFNAVRVVMRVTSEADAESLRGLAMYSAVYDIVANSLPVEVVLEKG